ncbi:MAG: carbohydrate kinase family protein [Gaiellaceae bacterium]
MIVCAIGDLTLDVLVRLDGSLSNGGDTAAEIRFSPGGQAANVAAWAAALGAQARFLGKRGDDEPGRLALAGLEAAGVTVCGPADGRNGVICALVSPDGERSMAADRGAAAVLRPDEIDPSWLEGCEHLFVSGYALLREPTRSAALLAVELGRAQDAGVSVDLATWSAIRDAGAAEFREAVAKVAPDVVFATESEVEIFGERLPDTYWIVKRGARGCVFGEDERSALPVERVVDTTGAGDALAAGWIVGRPGLALEAAARCVQHLGTMP